MIATPKPSHKTLLSRHLSFSQPSSSPPKQQPEQQSLSPQIIDKTQNRISSRGITAMPNTIITTVQQITNNNNNNNTTTGTNINSPTTTITTTTTTTTTTSSTTNGHSSNSNITVKEINVIIKEDDDFNMNVYQKVSCNEIYGTKNTNSSLYSTAINDHL